MTSQVRSAPSGQTDADGEDAFAVFSDEGTRPVPAAGSDLRADNIRLGGGAIAAIESPRDVVKSLGEGAFLGWCALCGREVLASERHLRVRGLVLHERCAAFRRRRLSAGVLRVARLPITALSLHGERAHKSRWGVLEATARALNA